jgi:hypothetical protein
MKLIIFLYIFYDEKNPKQNKNLKQIRLQGTVCRRPNLQTKVKCQTLTRKCHTFN